ADQYDLRGPRILERKLLAEQAALRREQYDARVRRILLHVLDCAEERLGFHHHPGPASERPVVNLPVPVFGEVTQIVNADLEQVRLDRAANYSKVKDLDENLREDRYDVEPHDSSLIGNRGLLIRRLQFQKSFRRRNRDALCRYINLRTDIIGEGNQMFTPILALHNQKVRASGSQKARDETELSSIARHHFRAYQLTLKE